MNQKLARRIANNYLNTLSPQMIEALLEVGGSFSYKEASAHKKSIALMKFLSNAAQKLGVGRHVYVVGGAVRNFVIDQPIKDLDIVLDSVALKGRDSEWFAKQLQGLIPAKSSLQTNQYGVAILSVSESWMLDGADLQGEVIEIANARKESYGGSEGKGYKPHMVEPSTVQEDVIRREFTFNTLLWRLADLANGPDKAEIIDMTGCGLKDLKDGVMRCPSDPDKTFSDDPSRLFRVVKFMVKYNFKLDPLVEKAVKRNAHKLKQAPPAALAKILVQDILHSNQAKPTLELLKKLGLLDVVAEIMEKDKMFKQTLVNWAARDATILFLFDLMDIGLPMTARFSFLSKEQVDRLRLIALDMPHKEAWDFVDLLKQPGRMIDTHALSEEFDLQGRDIRKIMDAGREVLLSHPGLRNKSKVLTDKVRKML